MSDQPPASGVAGILDRLLRFIDAPWKAVVVVVLLVVGGIGWTAYDKRDELLEAWLTPAAPGLKKADVPEAITKLASETSADLVQVWEVDLASNSQWFLAARLRDGERPVIPTPRTLPIIDRTSDAQRLLDVMEGRAICVDLTAEGSPIAKRLLERGMKRGCAVPIPPTPEAFLGIIYLAWAVAPSAGDENVAVHAAREIAGTLATH